MTSAIVGQAVLGWLAADLFSGAFHWWQDRVLRLRTPFLGSYLAAHAILHHREPRAFLAGSFLYRNGATFALAGVIGGGLLLVAGPSVFLAAFAAGGALTTQAHEWSHRPGRVPRLVAIAQDTGALQSPRQHARHHRAPHTARFCLLTDWCNPILDALDVWGRLERVLTATRIRRFP